MESLSNIFESTVSTISNNVDSMLDLFNIFFPKEAEEQYAKKVEEEYMNMSDLQRLLTQGGVDMFMPPVGMVKAFHGSPAKFTKFADEFMSSGTGGQVFGWGHYVSELPEVGKYYYELAFKKGEKYSLTTLKSQLKDTTETIAELKELLKKDKSSWHQPNIDSLEKFKIELEDKIANYGKKPTASLYEVEVLPELASHEENWLDWYEPITKEKGQKVVDKLIEENHFSLARDIQRTINDPNSYLTGKDLYYDLSALFSSKTGLTRGDKSASKFLERAGFHGNRYPVGTLNPGKVPKKILQWNKLGQYQKDAVFDKMKELRPNLMEQFGISDQYSNFNKFMDRGGSLYPNGPRDVNLLSSIQDLMTEAGEALGYIKQDYNYVVFNPEHINIIKDITPDIL